MHIITRKQKKNWEKLENTFFFSFKTLGADENWLAFMFALD